jgi:error-prone DNA polymerase
VRRLPDDSPLPLFAHEGNRGAAPEMGAEAIAPLPRMPESQEVVADYQTLRLSLKGYPTQFLRPLFDAEKIMPCAGLETLADGARARVAGVVLVRQRPGEGKAIFITLSDETGIANLVLWESVFPRFRKEAMGSRLLLAEGKVQKSPEGVLHLMVEKLIDRSADLSRLYADDPELPSPAHRHPRDVRILPPSRDFH